ncbi:hypothetical protein Tco_1423905 [Tanacetum coccineum]
MEKVEKDGVIADDNTLDNELEVVEGMKLGRESKIIVSEKGQSAMQTEATTSSGTNVKPSTLLLVYLMFKRSMEKLQIDKSSSGASAFKKKPVIIIVVGLAGRNYRKRLFNMINDLPTVFDVVALSSKKQPAEKSAVSNHSSTKSKSNTKGVKQISSVSRI